MIYTKVYNVKITPYDDEDDYKEYSYITIHTNFFQWFDFSSIRYDGCPMKRITILGITISWGHFYEYIEQT